MSVTQGASAGIARINVPGLVRQIVYNVRDFLAAGDGATDDTAAIQAAITAASQVNTGGGTVYLPAGKYKTTSTLTLPNSVALVGVGWGSTYIIPYDTSHDVIAVNVGGGSKSFHHTLSGFAIYPLTNFTAGAGVHWGNTGKGTMRDVKIDGSLGGKCYVGVQLDEVSDTAFSNVRVEGTISDGWLLQTADTKTIVEVFWDASCTARGAGGWGMRVAPVNPTSGDIEGLHWESTGIYGNTSGGIMLDSGASGTKTIRNIHLNGTYLDTNSGPGLQLTGTPTAENVIIQNVWVSANTGRGLDLGSNLRWFHVFGGAVMLNGGDGIRINGCQNGVVGGMLIKSNSQVTDLASYGLYVTGAAQEIVFSAFNVGNDSGYAKRQNGLFVDSTVLDLDFYPCKIDTGAGTTKLSHNAASSQRVRYHTVRDNTGSNLVWQLKSGSSGTDVATVDLFGNASNAGTTKSAGFLETISTKTSNYTLTNTDATVIANAATLTITLPAASGAGSGRRYTIKNGPSGTNTAIGSAGGTIDGNAAPWSPAALSAAFGKVSVIGDGSNWLTVA